MSGFTPIFATLSEEDIINLEKDRDKELKRRRYPVEVVMPSSSA
jgi:hypothetical protein